MFASGVPFKHFRANRVPAFGLAQIDVVVNDEGRWIAARSCHANAQRPHALATLASVNSPVYFTPGCKGRTLDWIARCHSIASSLRRAAFLMAWSGRANRTLYHMRDQAKASLSLRQPRRGQGSRRMAVQL
jgi:hypothetical protein